MTLRNRRFSKSSTSTTRKLGGTDDGMAVIKDHLPTSRAPVRRSSLTQRKKFVSLAIFNCFSKDGAITFADVELFRAVFCCLK